MMESRWKNNGRIMMVEFMMVEFMMIEFMIVET